MTQEKDACGHPFDWIDPQAEYWATHGKKEPVSDPFVSRQWIDNTPDQDPWTNGRYALAAVVWGLIALVVIGVGAGP
jgi:hypothetical protein